MSNPAGAPAPNVTVSNRQIQTYQALPDGSGDPTSQGIVPLDENDNALAYADQGGGVTKTWNPLTHTWNP